MAIKMVREPSITPNINNTDDFIPIRYGYGNQNGYIKDKGNEIGYIIDGNNFTITSGRLVLQGVECDIDSNGFTITTNQSISSPLYYTVYYEVDLENNEVSIKSENSTTNYPSIDSGDDLTHTINGVAKLVLYKFISTAGVISNVQKLINKIDYTMNIIDSKFNKDTLTTFGNYVIPKQKIVWFGNLLIGSINEVEVTDFTPESNKFYKFILGNGFTSYIFEYYMGNISHEGFPSFVTLNFGERIIALEYNGNLIKQNFIQLEVKRNTDLTNNIKLYLKNIIQSISLENYSINTNAGNFYLYKIYEIIE